MEHTETRPEPSVRGLLDDATPLAQCVARLWHLRLTGTLAIQCHRAGDQLAGESLVVFEDGALTQVRLPVVADPLGLILCEQRAIDADQLRASLRPVAEGRALQGAALRAMGACDATWIEWGLREQLRRKAVRLLALPGGDCEYQYYSRCDLLRGYGAERYPVDPRPVLLWGVLAQPPRAAVERVLAGLRGRWLALSAEADLAAFEFDASHQPLLERLARGPAPAGLLLESCGDVRLASALLYVLAITRQVDPIAPDAALPREPDAAAPRVRTQVPSRSAVFARPSAETTAGRDAATPAGADDPTLDESIEIETEAATEAPVDAAAEAAHAAAERQLAIMRDQTYLEMLGVAADATPDAVRAAFAQRASSWHPDRAAGAPAELAAVHARIVALLLEARATLADEAARARYLQTLQDGGGTPNTQHKVAVILDAAADAQKAEVCLRRADYAEAERLARRALEANEDDAGALTVLAAIRLRTAPEGPFDEAEALLRRAVKAAPRSDQPHYLLGTLFKRRGALRRALFHFHRAALANPRNVDALREVRLAARGHGAAPGGKSQSRDASGMFSRLFGLHRA